MKINIFAALLSVAALSGCVSQVQVTSRSTGEIGTGQMLDVGAAQNGTMKINFAAESYVGTWLVPVKQSIFALGNPSDSGSAMLRSAKGNELVCQFTYAVPSYVGQGTCTKNKKETFIFKMGVK